MVYLILAIICGASLAVCFKLFRKLGIDTLQGVFFNYIVAIIVSLALSDAGTEGLLFMGGILVLAASTQRSGVARTNVSARASLALTVIACWLMFDESEPNWLAVAMALAGMYLIFGTACVFCVITYLVRDNFKQHPFSWKSIVGGVVYPIYNVGVVVASLLIGVLFFKEKIRPVQLGGIALISSSRVWSYPRGSCPLFQERASKRSIFTCVSSHVSRTSHFCHFCDVSAGKVQHPSQKRRNCDIWWAGR